MTDIGVNDEDRFAMAEPTQPVHVAVACKVYLSCLDTMGIHIIINSARFKNVPPSHLFVLECKTELHRETRPLYE